MKGFEPPQALRLPDPKSGASQPLRHIRIVGMVGLEPTRAFAQLLLRQPPIPVRVHAVFVGTAEVEPACNQLPFLLCIRQRGYVPYYCRLGETRTHTSFRTDAFEAPAFTITPQAVFIAQCRIELQT